MSRKWPKFILPPPKNSPNCLPDSDCGECGFDSCLAFAAALLEKKVEPHKCPDLDAEFQNKLAVIVDLNKDPIPYNIMMEQHPCELIEINAPDEKSPLLVTANFRETVSIMKGILEATATRSLFTAHLYPRLLSG